MVRYRVNLSIVPLLAIQCINCSRYLTEIAINYSFFTTPQPRWQNVELFLVRTGTFWTVWLYIYETSLSCVKITLDQPRVRFRFETTATALQKNRWICLARVWTTKLKYLATEMKESKYSTESTVTLSRLTPPSFEK